MNVYEQKGGYQTPRQQKRELTIFNHSNEWVPGFGCCQIGGDAPGDAGGQHVIGIIKPDGFAAQDAARYLFNGPNPIPPKRPGTGTWDFPAQALRDSGNDLIGNNDQCGPRADSWRLWGGGNAFRLQGVGNPGVAIEDQVIWVAPSSYAERPAFTHSQWPALTARPGHQLSNASLSVSQNRWSQTYFQSEHFGKSAGAKIARPGTWFFSASATVWADADTPDQWLQVMLHLGGDDTATGGPKRKTTPLRAARQHQVLAEGRVAKENVSFSGSLLIREDHIEDYGANSALAASVVNVSVVDILYSHFMLHAHYIGGFPAWEEGSSPLSGGWIAGWPLA